MDDHTSELPVIEGTLIRLEVDRLPGGHDPLPVWLCTSATGLTGEDLDLRRQAFLRRFDLEHAFRMIKQTLGWTRPKLRTPEAADQWTWLVIAAHTQLRLARPNELLPCPHPASLLQIQLVVKITYAHRLLQQVFDAQQAPA